MSFVNKMSITKKDYLNSIRGIDSQIGLKKVAIVALTEVGRKQAQVIRRQFTSADIYVPEKRIKQSSEKVLPAKKVKESLQLLFRDYDYLICIMATGIVVRSLDGVLEDKRYDPAILVLDEKAQFVISLLSGHIGGANDLTRELAHRLEAIPVITTATDTQNVTALDLIAKEVEGWYENFRENTLEFNSLLASHASVGFYQDKDYIQDTRGLTVLKNLELIPCDLDGLIVVSPQLKLPKLYDILIPKVQVIPKNYILGMGSRKGVSDSIVNQAFTIFCELHNIHYRSIKEIVSIDVKKNEIGLINLANKLNCPFNTYSKEELEEASYFYPSSEFVKKNVGIGNVASASAHVASNGKVLSERFSYQGVTIVLAQVTKI